MALEKGIINNVFEPSPSASSDIPREETSTYIDKHVERRVLRKLDFQLVPVLWALCMYSVLIFSKMVHYSPFCFRKLILKHGS